MADDNVSSPKSDRELLVLIYERQKSSYATLLDVKKEVERTNGRVTALEIWKAKLGGAWVAIILGSTVMGTVLSIAISFVVEYFRH